MKQFLLLLFLISYQYGSSQKGSLKSQVNNLENVGKEFLGCKSDYWKIVSKGKAAIPLLIEKLDDSRKTAVSYKCVEKNLKVGDLAFLLLNEIINMPLFEVTKIQFDWYESNGCRGGVFEYLDSHRREFKTQFKAYYSKKSDKLKYQKYIDDDESELQFCRKINNIKGYYSE